MSQDPYATPKAASSIAGSESRLRTRWIAVLLSFLLPPIGMLYVVRPIRALVYLAVAVLIFLGGVGLGIKGFAEPALVTGLGGLIWRLAGAVDGYRLAPLWAGGALPWYSRPPALILFFIAAVLSILSLRAFLIEPFRIPASSMRPTLQVGDHILVDKTSYGWDVPLTDRRFLHFAGPRRGDVAVFRFPQDRSLYYIMRVVGLPGETVAYTDKRLRINDREVRTSEDGSEIMRGGKLLRYEERLDDVSHGILLDPDAPPFVRTAVRDFPGKDHCRYNDAGFACKVPAGHYFVMGDNRDNASDSRYWGFVPEHDFIGRALLIWYSPNPERAGTDVR